MPLEGSTLERGEQIEDRGVKMENADWRVENVRMEFYSLLCHHSVAGVVISRPPRQVNSVRKFSLRTEKERGSA